jgi:hypothetical protein
VLFGPYCRWETPGIQTKELAKLQAASGEIWGLTPKHGMEPTVQAYPYPLAANRRGIEFTTDIAAQPNQSPQEIRWYLYQTPGVLLRQKDGKDFACILADVDNRQP